MQNISGSSPLSKTDVQSFGEQINTENKPEQSIFATQQTFSFNSSTPNVLGATFNKVDEAADQFEKNDRTEMEESLDTAISDENDSSADQNSHEK